MRAPELPCAIRDWTPSTDRPFVADSWVKTLRASTRESRRVQESAFFKHHNKRIDAILDDAKTVVRVASPPDDEFTIYGYFVFRPPDLAHMLFVKLPLRNRGIARKLANGFEVAKAVFTHWSVDLAEWILPKLSRQVGVDKWHRPRFTCDVTYNPYWSEE